MHALYTLLQNSFENIYSTHRGCDINTVLVAMQDCEYIAARVSYTHDCISAVCQWLDVGPSVSCCSCCLQHEGSEVEKQSQEVVKHILKKGRQNLLEIIAKKKLQTSLQTTLMFHYVIQRLHQKFNPIR